MKHIKNHYYILGLGIIVFSLFSCGNGNGKADGYGNFEATEITISAENNGKLVQFDVDEGGWPVPFPISEPDTVNKWKEALGFNALENSLSRCVSRNSSAVSNNQLLTRQINSRKNRAGLISNESVKDNSYEVQILYMRCFYRYPFRRQSTCSIAQRRRTLETENAASCKGI
jgi:hypothetical protein